MSYEEKGIWVYLVVTIATFTGFVAIVLRDAAGGPLAAVDYLPTLLWSIGISIGAAIIGRVLVEVVRPSDSYTTDSRDRDINRRGEHIGGLVLGIGMVGPFVLAVLEADHFWIVSAMFATFTLYAVVGSIVKLVAYRRGM